MQAESMSNCPVSTGRRGRKYGFQQCGFAVGTAVNSRGDQTRDQSQELLAFVTDTRHALRDAQQVAGATGTIFAQTTLVRPRSASRNRLMRTRMSGGVGRAISDDGPYPIYSIVILD